MNHTRTVHTLVLAAGLAALSAPAGPAMALSLDSDSDIVRIATEAPDVADELTARRLLGLVDEPARVILLSANCGSEGCYRYYLVTLPFTEHGIGYIENTVLAEVAMGPHGKVLWAYPAALQAVEIDRQGHRRSGTDEREKVEKRVNDALRHGAFNLDAIRDPAWQTDLVACVSKARAAFGPVLSSKDPYPHPTFMFVVRRTQDAEGQLPDADVYLIDGYSEAGATGYVWDGTLAHSQRGRKSIFPVSEIMDVMRVSPDAIVEGPFTPPCLRPTPAPER